MEEVESQLNKLTISKDSNSASSAAPKSEDPADEKREIEKKIRNLRKKVTFCTLAVLSHLLKMIFFFFFR